MRIFRYAALLWGLSAPLWCVAQKYHSTRYSLPEGLPSEQVRAVEPGRYGFLWIATDGGLLRFDGRTFSDYQPALSSYYIKAFARMSDSTLAFANDNGVHLIHEMTDTARIECLIPGLMMPSDTSVMYPNRLFFSRKGALWISQPNGRLSRWQDGRLKHFDFGEGHATGYSNSTFIVVESRAGVLFAGASTGQLYRFDEREGGFVREDITLPAIHCAYQAGDSLWLGSQGVYLLQMDGGKLNGLQHFPVEGKTISSLSLAKTGDVLLLGTNGQGLYQGQFYGRQMSLQRVFGGNDPHRIDQLPFHHIHQIVIDEKENIWLSTGQGLGLLQSRFFETVFGLANNNTFAILPVEGQEVLVSFGDLHEISREGTDFFGQLVPGLGLGFITGITHDGQQLWLSTANAELFSYQHGSLQQEANLSKRGGGIFFIYADHGRNLWFCQAPSESPIVGVGKRLPNGALRFYDAEDGLSDRILVVRESDKQQLYAAGIGPTSYLFRYQPRQDAFINLSLPLPFPYSSAFEVHDMAIDEQGIVWLGTTDGLLKYDLERIVRVDLGPNTSTEIRSLAAIKGGSLWLATDTDGLIYYHDGQYTTFDENSGIPSKIASYRCLAASPSGRIWHGTAEGLVHSRDRNPRPDTTPVPIFQELRADGKKIAVGATVEISRKNRLSLRWTTPAFPARNLQYAYRLLGSPDSIWSGLGTARRLSLPPLLHGQYRLEVRALQAGGFQWSQPVGIAIEVYRPWYQRWWGIALLALLGLLSLYGLFRFNFSRLLRRIRVLEHDLAEREQELQRQESLLERKEKGLEAARTELSERQSEMATALYNLALLHQLIQAMPHDASLKEVVDALAGSTGSNTGIDAFEFGYFYENEMRYRGYSRRSGSTTLRTEEFNEKGSLPAWVLVNQKALLIGDFRSEHTQYIEPVDGYLYQSAVFLPLEPNGQQLVFCVYGIRKQVFNERALQMLQILADYLAVAIKDIGKAW